MQACMLSRPRAAAAVPSRWALRQRSSSGAALVWHSAAPAPGRAVRGLRLRAAKEERSTDQVKSRVSKIEEEILRQREQIAAQRASIAAQRATLESQQAELVREVVQTGAGPLLFVN